MFGLMALGGLFVVAFLVLAVFGLVALLIKAILLLVLLPFKLVFGLTRGLIGLILLPVFLVVGGLVAVLAIVGGLFALAVPLLPLAALVFVVWLITRSNRKPAAV